jgi:two-component system NarL family response regulator
VYQAVRAGAAAYLLKASLTDDLVPAIREVHRGERRVPPAIAARLAEHVARPALTRRELSGEQGERLTKESTSLDNLTFKRGLIGSYVHRRVGQARDRDQHGRPGTHNS